MKERLKGIVSAILILLLILNSSAVFIYAGCFIDKITNPSQIGWVEMDSATGWGLYTIMFITIEVILLAVIIRLFAKKSVQASKNSNGDKDEHTLRYGKKP